MKGESNDIPNNSILLWTDCVEIREWAYLPDGRIGVGWIGLSFHVPMIDLIDTQLGEKGNPTHNRGGRAHHFLQIIVVARHDADPKQDEMAF